MSTGSFDKNLLGPPKPPGGQLPLSEYSFGQLAERPEVGTLGTKMVKDTSLENSPRKESTGSAREKADGTEGAQLEGAYVNPIEALETGGAFSRAMTLLGYAAGVSSTPAKIKSLEALDESPDPDSAIGFGGPVYSSSSFPTPGFVGSETAIGTKTKNLITNESCPVVTDLDLEARLRDSLCPKPG
jgi:hypothetical protein